MLYGSQRFVLEKKNRPLAPLAPLASLKLLAQRVYRSTNFKVSAKLQLLIEIPLYFRWQDLLRHTHKCHKSGLLEG